MTNIALRSRETSRNSVSTAPRSVSIFGATGSVGSSTLDLIRLAPDAYRIVALTAHSNCTQLAALAREFRPDIAVIADPDKHDELREALADTDIETAAGGEALVEAAARDADWTMAAIVGCAGLEPIMRSLKRGGAVALANKEALVSAGQLMMEAASESGADLLPVDSEHNAIFQCLAGGRLDEVRKITLTASGGPFRAMPLHEMRGVTPAQAVAHPNWDMGAKISVDSATMMNKGLELIEAHHLFPVGHENIAILVHPQSVIHSMVEFRDRSTLAQLGAPDMKIPIAHALAWPRRMATQCTPLDLGTIGSLTFEELDTERFPAPGLCRSAIAAGGAASAVLNAANEVAVAAFLAKTIGLLEICAIVLEVLDRYSPTGPQQVADVVAIDAEARRIAQEEVARRRN